MRHSEGRLALQRAGDLCLNAVCSHPCALSESFDSVSLYTAPLIGDLLKLVHLSNGGDSGKTVRVSGHALHEGNPAIEEVQSTLFFRGSFTYDDNIFGRLMSLNTLLSLSGVLMFES